MNVKIRLFYVLIFSSLIIGNALLFAQTYTYSISGGGTNDVNGVYVQGGTYYDATSNTTNDYYVKVSGTSAVMTIYLYGGYWTILPSISNQGTWDYYWNNNPPPTLPLGGSSNGASGSYWDPLGGGQGSSPYPISSQNTIANMTFADGSGYTPSSGTPNTTDNPIGRFQLIGTSVGGVLQGLTISLSGTNSFVSNIQLWSSSSSTFSTGTATSLATVATYNTSISFSSFNSLIDNSSGTYYFITVDLASGATGNVAASIPSPSSFTFAGANQPSSFSNALLSSGATALPVELNTFLAVKNENTIELEWATATEVNNYGFNVERAISKNGTMGSFEKIGFVPGHGNTNSPHDYSFVDENPAADNLVYRLKQVDNDGSFKYSKEVTVILSKPLEFKLGQNYPNPFNPSTNISFSIPERGNVMLKVYNTLGQEVATLINGQLEAGFHSINFNADNLASGVYVYRLEVNGKYSSEKKMNLIK